MRITLWCRTDDNAAVGFAWSTQQVLWPIEARDIPVTSFVGLVKTSTYDISHKPSLWLSAIKIRVPYLKCIYIYIYIYMLSQSFEVGLYYAMDIEEYLWTHVIYDSLSIYFLCFVFVINVFLLPIINNADCHKQADLFSVSCDSTVWWTTISG